MGFVGLSLAPTGGRSWIVMPSARHVRSSRSETVLARSREIRAARQILRFRLDQGGGYEAPAAAGPASIRAAARTSRRRRKSLPLDVPAFHLGDAHTPPTSTPSPSGGAFSQRSSLQRWL